MPSYEVAKRSDKLLNYDYLMSVLNFRSTSKCAEQNEPLNLMEVSNGGRILIHTVRRGHEDTE